MVRTLLIICALLLYSSVFAQNQYFREETASRLPITPYTSIHSDAADIDDDGDYDILASIINFGQPYSQCYLFINEGNGYFTWESSERLPDTATHFSDVAFAPIDNDNSYDIYLRSEHGINLIYINDGFGYFEDETLQRYSSTECGGDAGFIFADFTGDSKWDIITICGGPGQASQFMLNDGNGYFIDNTAIRMPEDTTEDYKGHAADYDNDLDLDLFLSGYKPGFGFNIRGLENLGELFINFPGAYLPDHSSYRIDSADIDFDGDLDLIIAGGGEVGILINYGQMFVDESSQRLPALPPQGTVTSTGLGDFDNDGDIDIFATLAVLTRNHYFLNDGQGYFTLADDRIPDSLASYRWAEPLDADNDGDLDIFLSCSVPGQQRLLINYSTPDTIAPRILAQELPRGTIDSALQYWVRISAYDNISVEKGALDLLISYRVDSAEWRRDHFNYCGGTVFSYPIPSQPRGSYVEYYVTIQDRMRNIAFSPQNAPDSVHSFWVEEISAIYGVALVPQALHLSVYPNPFNSVTTITLNDMRGGDIEIRIYDMQGRLIKELQAPNFQGGDKKAVWDATDNSGRRVSSGIYFVRVETPQTVKINKFLYLK